MAGAKRSLSEIEPVEHPPLKKPKLGDEDEDTEMTEPEHPFCAFLKAEVEGGEEIHDALSELYSECEMSYGASDLLQNLMYAMLQKVLTPFNPSEAESKEEYVGTWGDHAELPSGNISRTDFAQNAQSHYPHQWKKYNDHAEQIPNIASFNNFLREKNIVADNETAASIGTFLLVVLFGICGEGASFCDQIGVGWCTVGHIEWALSDQEQFSDLPLPMEYHLRDLRQVMFRDDIIDKMTLTNLKSCLNQIAEQPLKDFHPGSDGKVQDLIHPHLYSLVRDVTPLLNGKSFIIPTKKKLGFFERDPEDSRFQWLPSDVSVFDDGRVEYTSYINGLVGARHENLELFTAIESVLSSMIPLMEDCLRELYLELRHAEDPPSLRNRSIQVITKAVNYVLQPKQTHQGVWHIEGMPHEHIIASGIYYYETSSSMTDSGLSFRRSTTIDELITSYEQNEGPEGLKTSLELGTMETSEGRCIVFPNNHQHKLMGLENTSDDEVAVRKILCFFLIDPNERVISTADVLDQRREVQVENVGKAICDVSAKMKYNLVEDVVRELIEFVVDGMTLGQAKVFREELMHERSFYKSTMNEELEREINFCEH